MRHPVQDVHLRNRRVSGFELGPQPARVLVGLRGLEASLPTQQCCKAYSYMSDSQCSCRLLSHLHPLLGRPLLERVRPGGGDSLRNQSASARGRWKG